MTGDDEQYFARCHQLGLVQSPLLEIGAARVQPGARNVCDLARQCGVAAVAGVDLARGSGVDFTSDFSTPPEAFARDWQHGAYATVAIFNVLEHTFDPITVLANALHCTAPGGRLLVVTPVVWPLHRYPQDCVRLMPDWYRAFAARFGVTLRSDAFCWLSQFGVRPIDDQAGSARGEARLPSFLTEARGQSAARYWSSRVVHRVFNTYGRSHPFTHAAIGAAFTRPL